MSTAESPSGFELVVGKDGSISADELRRYGIRPGAHLRVVEEVADSGEKKLLRGALKDLIDVEAIDQGLLEAKNDRTNAVEQNDDQ